MSDIPEWALDRAVEIVNQDGSTYDPYSLLNGGHWSSSIGQAFARYIAEHEEPPVDPLLIEARDLAGYFAEELDRHKYPHEEIRRGDFDNNPRAGVSFALAALKRGIELSQKEQAK